MSSFEKQFGTWEEAKKHTSGYDSPVIAEKVKNALLKVIRGEAVFERDSVLFQTAEYTWPLLTGLMWVAAQNKNVLNVIDFGGSLGSLYFQNRMFLQDLDTLNWNVVEQESFIKYGKEYFEDGHLKYYASIDDCLGEQRADTIILSGVIQYLEKPYDFLTNIVEKGFKYILIDRTSFTLNEGDCIMVQAVSPEIYDASYPVWFLDLERVKKIFTAKYSLIAEFDSLDVVDYPSRFMGFIYKLGKQ